MGESNSIERLVCGLQNQKGKGSRLADGLLLYLVLFYTKISFNLLIRDKCLGTYLMKFSTIRQIQYFLKD